MNSPKDYLRRGWIGTFALIAVLAVLSLIPPQTIGGVEFRRANIFSDVLSFDDVPAAEQSGAFKVEDFLVDMEEVSEIIGADTVAPSVRITYEWRIGNRTARSGKIRPDSMLLSPKLIPIEDFEPSANGGMASFYDTLLYSGRAVRIAVLGDSFIEGDILTADLREKMQQTYGGGGTGFAPMASPLTAFRRTVKTQSKGWTSYNIMQRRSAPESVRGNFYVSGWVSQPSAGASTRWESTDFRKQLDSCTAARMFFISPRNSRIEVTVNDTLRREFAVDGNAAVRQITVGGAHIHSLGFRVLSGAEGFIGYGAILESNGVVVDNYSIRSNNGQAMFWTNPSVNAQINALTGYDLVVLQYGLNIMQAGVRNYANYSQQIEKMVTYVRQCFPGAAVLVMGVSDRAVRGESGVAPMDAVPYMIEYQRRAADKCGAAFWPTSESMRALGGMTRFVSEGWAGKDFTHINYAGGRRIGYALFDALNAGAAEYYGHTTFRHSREKQPAIIDSVERRQISRMLMKEMISDKINKPKPWPTQQN